MLRISAKIRIMAARLRPARATEIRREASPIAEDISINREHGACCSCVAKHADLTEGGHPLGCLRLRRQAAGGAADRAHAPIASQPSPSALSSKTQNRWLALARLRRGTSPAEPAKGIGSRLVVTTECFPVGAQERVMCNTSSLPYPAIA